MTEEYFILKKTHNLGDGDFCLLPGIPGHHVPYLTPKMCILTEKSEEIPFIIPSSDDYLKHETVGPIISDPYSENIFTLGSKIYFYIQSAVNQDIIDVHKTLSRYNSIRIEE